MVKIKKPLGSIRRRLRGLVRSCDRCGSKRQELFKMHSFPSSGERVNYYCSHCYSKILRRPKEF